MKSKKKSIKKAAKKEAVKVVKKVLKKKVSLRTRRMNPNALHGRGGYWGDLGKRLGGHIGGVADEVLGVGKALTGVGSYKIKSNSIYESGGPPSIVNSKYSWRVRHREFLGDVTGSTSFTVTNYPINPGVSGTFPWLSSQAVGAEQYKVHGMVFEFCSTSANSVTSTNTALGSVIMATEYNTNLPAFTSKMQMENHEYTTTTSPVHNAIHPIECARSRTVLDELYVRSGTTGNAGPTNLPNSFNPLLYDLGNFQLATVGMQASAVIGELWVSYEIEFLKPTMSTTLPNARMSHFYWDSTLGSAPASGTFMNNVREANTSITFTGGTNGINSVAPGNWFLVIALGHSSGAVTFPNLALTGASAYNILFTNPATGVPAGAQITGPQGGATATTSVAVYTITAATSWTLQFQSCTIPTLTSYDLFLIPFGTSLKLAESRRAVDWDPVAVLTRRLQELECRLPSFHEDEEEKYCDSDVSTPIHVQKSDEPELTRSQANLASILLDRLSVRDTASKTGLSVRSA